MLSDQIAWRDGHFGPKYRLDEAAELYSGSPPRALKILCLRSVSRRLALSWHRQASWAAAARSVGASVYRLGVLTLFVEEIMNARTKGRVLEQCWQAERTLRQHPLRLFRGVELVMSRRPRECI